MDNAKDCQPEEKTGTSWRRRRLGSARSCTTGHPNETGRRICGNGTREDAKRHDKAAGRAYRHQETVSTGVATFQILVSIPTPMTDCKRSTDLL